MTTTTWNPSDETGITLSGSNMIATASSFNFNGIRATTFKLLTGTDKTYFEVTANASWSDSRGGVGFADSSAILGSGSPGNVGHTGGINTAGTLISSAGFDTISVSFGNVSSKTFGIAIDVAAKKWWITKDGTTWNAGGTANPATGIGEVDFTTQFTTSITPYVTIIDSGASATLNTGNSTFLYTIPSGFVAWDAPQNVWASTEAADHFAAGGFPGAFGKVGDLASTEAKDVLAAVGFPRLNGFLQVSENADIFSAFGRQPATAALHATENTDIFAGIGVGRGENGVWISTEGIDTLTMIGHTPVSGTWASVEAADRFSAIGAGVTRVRRRRTFFAT